MGYLIAYLLLALVFDLLRELVNPEGDHRNADAIHRRLWSDTHFDCRTRVFSVEENTPRHFSRQLPSKPRAKQQVGHHRSTRFSWKPVKISYPVTVHQPSQTIDALKTFSPLQSWVCQRS